MFLLSLSCPLQAQSTNPHGIRFVEVKNAGFAREAHGDFSIFDDARKLSGGIAAGDYDQDGDVDLYIVGQTTNSNHLYQNQGDGTFIEVGSQIGVDVTHWGSGPAWGDIDGDGDLDLFVGAIDGNSFHMFENRANEEEGKFVDITDRSEIIGGAKNIVSALFFDYDVDGHLDLLLTHWDSYASGEFDTHTLYRNNGDSTFSSVGLETGISQQFADGTHDWSFTPNLSDIDNDGDYDLLLVADFGESQVFQNNGDGTFDNITDKSVIRDQHGMGAAVGDFDNDGYMDWFVTSIYDLDVSNGTRFGNRLYRNLGRGRFEDISVAAAVDDGAWGWGACAGDFDLDGNLDIVQLNGWNRITLEGARKDYSDLPIRFFRNRGTRQIVFDEIAEDAGIDNDGQGRGLACFDADRDGDLDIVVMNNSEDHIVYYRNETPSDHNFLTVRLKGITDNRMGVGSRITITTKEGKQIRELGGSNNYVSHNPLEAHFGLANADFADIEVRWPDGTLTNLHDVPANFLVDIVATETATRLIVRQGHGTGGYEPGEAVEIEAREPEEGYYFSHWTTNGDGSFEDEYSSITTFTVPDSSVTITAHFLPGVAPDADVSVARRWNEVLLAAIRNDYARPTVHARNLFHTSSAMYDAWSAYADVEQPWLLGSEQNGHECHWQRSNEEYDAETLAVLPRRGCQLCCL